MEDIGCALTICRINAEFQRIMEKATYAIKASKVGIFPAASTKRQDGNPLDCPLIITGAAVEALMRWELVPTRKERCGSVKIIGLRCRRMKLAHPCEQWK